MWELESEVMFHLLLGCAVSCQRSDDFFSAWASSSWVWKWALLCSEQMNTKCCGWFAAADSAAMRYKWDDEQFWLVEGGWRVWEKKGWQVRKEGNTSCSSRWCTWGFTAVLLAYVYSSIIMHSDSWCSPPVDERSCAPTVTPYWRVYSMKGLLEHAQACLTYSLLRSSLHFLFLCLLNLCTAKAVWMWTPQPFNHACLCWTNTSIMTD